jgi:hypothetical protein
MGLSTGTFGDVAIKAGDGGNAGSGLGGISGGNLQGWGGRGGHVSSLDLKVSGQVNLEAGAEGQAGPSRDPNVNGGFIVGSGGEIRDITFHANGDSADVTIVSGDGHDEANATWAGSTAYPNYGTAGYGGSISGIKFAEGTFAGVTLQSGKGGDGAISGGSGGSVTGISLAAAASVDSFVIKGGDGGDGVAGGPADGTKPGDGGNGSGASLSLLGTITSLVIEGGDGGDSLTGIGSGGWGESIGQFAAIIASGGSLQLKAGDGGSSGGTPHSNTFAGHGGWIQGIVVAGALPNTLISSIVLQGGLGGDGAAYDSLSGYHGTGDGGSISHFDSSGLVSESIDIFAGDGGDALKAESGGEGGSLTDITAVYSNTSTASVGSGGIGIAHGKDGTQTNVVLTDATP